MAKAKLTAEEQQEIEQLKARLTRMGEKFSPNIGLEALRNKVNGLLGDSDADLDEGDEPDLDDGLVDLDDDETEDTLLDDDELEDWEPVPTRESAGGEIDLTAELANIDFELDAPKTKRIKPVAAKDAAKLLAVKGSADDGRLTSLELNQALCKVSPKLRQQIQIKSANRLIRIRYTMHNPNKAKWPGEYLTTGNSVIGRITKYIPFNEASQAGYMVPYAIYEVMRDKRYYAPRVVNDDNKTSRVIDMNPKEYSIEVLPLPTKAELTKIAQRQAAQGND